MNALRERIDEMARDLARLQRRVEPGTSASFAVKRLGEQLTALDCMTMPSAAELRHDFVAVCGDEQIAVEEALAAVDARARELRLLLGEVEQ